MEIVGIIAVAVAMVALLNRVLRGQTNDPPPAPGISTPPAIQQDRADLIDVFYYGNEPRLAYSPRQAKFGSLWMDDQQLVFTPQHGSQELTIRFDQIRWIGQPAIRIEGAGRDRIAPLKQAIEVHYLDQERWCAAIWEIADTYYEARAARLEHFSDLLFARSRLAVYREASHVFGPSEATCMIQGIYGQWHSVAWQPAAPPPFAACRVSKAPLYLTPTGRLLFDYRYEVPLDQVRRVEAYTEGHLNPFAGQLLRLEYEIPGDPRRQSVGFIVEQAAQWGEVIAARASVPLEIHAGRKKK
jgi:hypothetical protein